MVFYPILGCFHSNCSINSDLFLVKRSELLSCAADLTVWGGEITHRSAWALTPFTYRALCVPRAHSSEEKHFYKGRIAAAAH